MTNARFVFLDNPTTKRLSSMFNDNGVDFINLIPFPVLKAALTANIDKSLFELAYMLQIPEHDVGYAHTRCYIEYGKEAFTLVIINSVDTI